MSVSGYSTLPNDLFNNYEQARKRLETLQTPVQKATPIKASNPGPCRYVRLRDHQNVDSFHSGDKITFKFPKNGFLDPSTLKFIFTTRFLLGFTVSPFTTGSAGFVYDISTLFRRIVIRHGQKELDSIEEYGHLKRVIGLVTDNPNQLFGQEAVHQGKIAFTAGSFHVSGVDQYLYHKRQMATAYGANTYGHPRKYCVDIFSGFLQQNKLIPLYLFNEQLFIDIYLEDAIKTVKTSQVLNPGSNVELDVSKPRLLYLELDGDANFKREFDIMVASSRLVFQYVSWDYNRFHLDNSVRVHRFPIKMRRPYLKYALATIRCFNDIEVRNDWFSTYIQLNPDVTQTETSGASTSWVARNTVLQSYQWSIGETKFPPEPVPVMTTKVLEDGAQIASKDVTHCSPAVEVWYHMEQLARGLNKRTSGAVINTELNFMPWDTYDPTLGFKHAFTGSIQGGRRPLCFAIPGVFTYTLPNGETVCHSAGADSNDTLTLELEFLRPSISPVTGLPVPGPRMYVDVFTAYDNYLQVNQNGESVLEC